VILATLVLQGLTLPALINYLRLKGETDTIADLRARLEGARAALEELEKTGDGRVPPNVLEDMRGSYEERIRRYEAGIEAGGTTEEYAQSSASWRDWRRSLISAERDAVVSMRDRGEISPETMRRIERDLDLEEARIGG
jgi:hypothetical protein